MKKLFFQRSGFYCGDLRWGNQAISFDESQGGLVLHYNSFICLVDGYDCANPSVFFASNITKGTFKKLSKLLSKDKKAYYEYIYKDFYSKRPKIDWLQFNARDSKAVFRSIQKGDMQPVEEIFNLQGVVANGFDYPMPEKLAK